MPHPAGADLDALVQTLLAARVEFIVVGGTAAVLHGAPIMTQDLDIVHRRTPENVHRLAQVLANVEATFRGRDLRPTPALLSGSGQLNLSTTLGPLDVLCVLHDGRGYDELLPHTEVLKDGATEIRVIDLDTLIAVKAAAARDRDKLALPILMALRDRAKPGR
jgi:predicted nucleotidyltransferase